MALDTRRSYYHSFLVLILSLLFFIFDERLAIAYVILIFLDYILFNQDKIIAFPIERDKSRRVRTVIEAVVAYGIFLAVATLLLNYVAPALANLQSMFKLMSTTTPILKGSKIFTFFGWAILVPIIETVLFNGRLLEGIADWWNARGGRINVYRIASMWYVVLIVAALFTGFHLTAKGAESIPLLITFIFSIISSILVIYQRSLLGAIIVHAISNSAVVLREVGLMSLLGYGG